MRSLTLSLIFHNFNLSMHNVEKMGKCLHTAKFLIFGHFSTLCIKVLRKLYDKTDFNVFLLCRTKSEYN